MSFDVAAVVARLVVCGRFVAADRADAEGFAGVGFLPSHENLLDDCEDFFAFFAELGEPDMAGPLVADDGDRAFVAEDNVLMLGPRLTRPD
jgi:hypothetical protein